MRQIEIFKEDVSKINIICTDDSQVVALRCVLLEAFLVYQSAADKQASHLIVIDSSGGPSWSLSVHTKRLWPAPTPRQATSGMLRLVFSHSSQAAGPQRAEIWSGPCLNMCFTMGVFRAALTAETPQIGKRPPFACCEQLNFNTHCIPLYYLLHVICIHLRIIQFFTFFFKYCWWFWLIGPYHTLGSQRRLLS